MSREALHSIPGVPRYSITKDERLWDTKRRKWLETHIRGGRLVVNLRRNNRQYVAYVHRLLLETFVGSCPPGMECRHLDGNKLNNNLDNLIWGTHQENAQDNVKHERGNRKLTVWEAIWIKYLLDLQRFTQSEIAKLFGTRQTVISNIRVGRTYVDAGRQL